MNRVKNAVAVLLVSAVIVGFANPAAAHYVYEKGRVYASSTDCVQVRSETSHGGGGGYAKSDVYAEYKFSTVIAGTIDCFSDWDRPPGYLAVRFDWFKWDGSQWALCGYTDWYYNPIETHQYAIQADFGSSPWCGNGYYGTVSHGYNLNGSWHGGDMWSGYHYLPA